MGIAYVEGSVQRGRGKRARVRFMVDTGALYTVFPAPVWQALGLRPMRRLEFVLADGTTIVRDVSECRVALAGRTATSPVVLGEAEDGPLLGTVTLETLGLMVNPLTRRVVPVSTLPLAALGAYSPSIFAM